jgi:hypothetical protein
MLPGATKETRQNVERIFMGADMAKSGLAASRIDLRSRDLDFDHHWRMVAWIFPASWLPADAGRLQPRCNGWRQQKMVDPKSAIALE